MAGNDPGPVGGALTVENAAALQAALLAWRDAAAPLAFAAVERVDLAGVQLLAAFACVRLQAGLPVFAEPLPDPVQDALRVAGFIGADGQLDMECMQ